MFKKHYIKLIFIYILPIIGFASTSLLAEDKKITNSQSDVLSDLTVAVVDTEYLFNKFIEDSNIRNKVLNDYKVAVRDLQGLPQESKQQRAMLESEKIYSHYSYQVSQIIIQAINEIVNERSLCLVVNKKTFLMNEKILPPETQRRMIPNQAVSNKQIVELFAQSILSAKCNCIDITQDVSNRITKLSSNIRILSYGRSLK
ncbi:MAG: hypothetical protein IKO19_07840 [Candidatus Riflebacteria bacterium]|nr:hypothetical protein [Candidatus Riflebacteria bacterium]